MPEQAQVAESLMPGDVLQHPLSCSLAEHSRPGISLGRSIQGTLSLAPTFPPTVIASGVEASRSSQTFISRSRTDPRGLALTTTLGLVLDI